MSEHTLSTSHGQRMKSYVIGFVSSIVLTIIAFGLVENHVLPHQALVMTVVGLAVIQLLVQLIFFLHIGRETGTRWKIVTFFFALIVIFIVVGGSIWIMNNLNYNMMNMTQIQQNTYMRNNEGI